MDRYVSRMKNIQSKGNLKECKLVTKSYYNSHIQDYKTITSFCRRGIAHLARCGWQERVAINSMPSNAPSLVSGASIESHDVEYYRGNQRGEAPFSTRDHVYKSLV